MSGQGGPTILVVDDDPQMLRAIVRSIRSPDYRLVETTDPRHAAALLAAEPVDVLLSDVDMPELDGHQLMAHARQVRPGAVRILITCRSTKASALRAINEGEVHRFVEKPFERAELRRIVAEAVARAEELARTSAAGERAGRRYTLFRALEAEHPGVTRIERDARGDYVLDPEAAEGLAAALGVTDFLKP
jgi:two-component system, probable response regulator PhcQ